MSNSLQTHLVSSKEHQACLLNHLHSFAHLHLPNLLQCDEFFNRLPVEQTLHHNDKYFLDYFLTITNANNFTYIIFNSNANHTSSITYNHNCNSIYNGSSTEDNAS